MEFAVFDYNYSLNGGLKLISNNFGAPKSPKVFSLYFQIVKAFLGQPRVQSQGAKQDGFYCIHILFLDLNLYKS